MIGRFSLESPDGRARVEVDPERGGRLASFSVDGRDLLVAQTSDPVTWGAYPMVPFAGRIRAGVLDFASVTYELPTTLGPHAMHGYGFVSPWERIDESSIRLEFDEPWPFAGSALQTFALHNCRLDLSMTVSAKQRQPVSFGWHPWFRRDIGSDDVASLEFAPGKMYERDGDGIPSGALVEPPPGPWDDCFTNVARPPVLTWGSFALTLSSSADHWVVYTEPKHALCVEPQTGPPNDVNDEPLVIEAGDSHTETFTLEW